VFCLVLRRRIVLRSCRFEQEGECMLGLPAFTLRCPSWSHIFFYLNIKEPYHYLLIHLILFLAFIDLHLSIVWCLQGYFCAWSLLASEVMCVSWLLRCWVLMAVVLWCLQTFTNDEGRGAVPCQWFEQASTDLHTPSHDNCSFSNWLDRSLCKI